MKTLTAFYDLTFGPISFDFVTWLIRARMEQEDAGAERLHVVVVPYEEGLGGFSRHWGPHDEHASRWRLWNIVLPACQLAGATVTLASSRSQSDLLGPPGALVWWPQGKAHLVGPIVAAARAGRRIPMLEASAHAKRCVAKAYGERVVTLTLRNNNPDDGRDTNPQHWDELAGLVRERGYVPVVVQDTRDALERGHGFAEFSLDLRLALYQRAALNLIGNNGPSVLCFFSSAPVIQIGVAEPRVPWADHYRRNMGLEIGDQLPWARPDQVLVYSSDRKTMLKTFAAWADARKAAA